jgi:hypothetical protein
MQKSQGERFDEMHQTVQQLVTALARSEERHARAVRRQRWFWLGITASLLALAYISGQFGTSAIAQTQRLSQPAAGPVDRVDRIAQRQALIAQLPEEAQAELAEFERSIEWLGRYLQTWDERQAGAVVALMLQRIGQNMNAMPKIHSEMQTMNSLMQAMPVVAVEMQRMSANLAVITANMGVMTHNMDSTMGRMGRMMPWP